MSEQRIGVVGLGTMGKVIAKRLLDAGHALTVWNRTRAAGDELVAAGAKWAESPAAVATDSDIVISMVSDAVACEAVILGDQGIIAGAHAELIVIDCASIEPDASQAIAEKLQAAGVAMLDAPVSGGPKVAAEGKLGIMVGGPPKAFERAQPVLEKLGSLVLHCGPNGKGTTLKLIANLVMGVAIEAVAESLVLAAKLGIDPQRVLEITSLPGTGPQTGAMTTRGPRMIQHNFFPAHFSTNNMHKDLTGAIRLAEKHGVSLPATSVAREMLRAVQAQGNGHIDSSAVVTVLEAMAQTSVSKKAD